MISGILGKKIGMTQIFKSGKCIPITVIAVEPCKVLQVKTSEKEGYYALQLGIGDKKEKNASKAEQGHAKKANCAAKRFVKEVAWDGKDEVKVGDDVKLDILEKIKYVDVTGTSKGHGFQGGMKRHGFHGGRKTHGQTDMWRSIGSIGCSATPARVIKGKKMPGQMGNVKRTVRNLEIIDIDENMNYLSVKGSIPGANGNYVIIKRSLIN